MKQKTILIMMAPAHGHLNCTFTFGHRLRVEGYRVIYAVPPQMQQKILQQGFETIICPTQLFTKRNATGINNEPKLENFFEILVDRITNRHLQLTKDAAKLMNLAIQKIQPDLLILDCFLVYNYLLIEGKKPKTILLQIMLDTSKRAGLPPLNSALLPNENNNFSERKISWAWKKLMWRKKWNRLINLGDSPLQIIYRLQKEQKAVIKAQLDFERVFHPGIKKIPELLLAPKAIDLPEISATNKIYIGSSMNRQRKEKVLGGRLKEVMEELKASYQEETWVYCSLGTLNKTHNKHSAKFFEKVIQVFKKKPQWELILSTGEIKPETFKHNLPNVHIFDSVPQLEVLKYCKVMITHGGVNSTLEGINNEVPMLVYPLNNNWDQNGDAVRVVHYGLGLMGKINQATIEEILQQLEELISNLSYKQHLVKMRQQIKEENGMDAAIDLVQEILREVINSKRNNKKEKILSIV